MSRGIKLAVEGGGFVTTCSCGWLRYAATRGVAEQHRGAHAKKCDGEKKGNR